MEQGQTPQPIFNYALFFILCSLYVGIVDWLCIWVLVLGSSLLPHCPLDRVMCPGLSIPYHIIEPISSTLLTHSYQGQWCKSLTAADQTEGDGTGNVCKRGTGDPLIRQLFSSKTAFHVTWRFLSSTFCLVSAGPFLRLEAVWYGSIFRRLNLYVHEWAEAATVSKGKDLWLRGESVIRRCDIEPGRNNKSKSNLAHVRPINWRSSNHSYA